MQTRTPQVSLRMRLTIWALAISALIQIVLASVFILYRRAALLEEFDRELKMRGNEIVQAMKASLPRETGQIVLLENSRRLFDHLIFDSIAVGIYDLSGHVVVSSWGAPATVLPQRVEAAVHSATPVIRTLPRDEAAVWSDGSPRSLKQSFTAQDGQKYVLAIYTSDIYVWRSLSLLIRAATIMIPAGVAAAGVGAWLIAGLAVAPLKNLQEVLSTLGPESITQHMQLDGGDREVKRLADELEAARRRIEQGFRAQERFMSNVSHELKTPISVVLAEAETLRREPSPGECDVFIRSTREEMLRLGAMIDSFLLLTRVHDGTRTTRSERYLVNELVLDSIEHCSVMAAQYEITLAPTLLQSDDDIDAGVCGDPHLLRTMLDNLVRNAIRFSPERRQVHIGASRLDGHAVIVVRDFGPGIPPNIIDRVFDRFSQGDAEARRGRGHGLGLEIAQGIAELHGGRINAENCEDAGCRFTIRLPLADEIESGDASPANSPASA